MMAVDFSTSSLQPIKSEVRSWSSSAFISRILLSPSVATPLFKLIM